MPTILNESAPLERYGHNLTMLAKFGAFSPLTGHETVVNRVFQVCSTSIIFIAWSAANRTDTQLMLPPF